MKKIDQITNHELSHRLLELGVPENRASLLWIDGSALLIRTGEMDFQGKGIKIAPAFTITDVENVLPAEIFQDKFQYRLTIEALSCPAGMQWRYSYKYSGIRGPKPPITNLIHAQGESRIETAVMMVSRLLWNGFKLAL